MNMHSHDANDKHRSSKQHWIDHSSSVNNHALPEWSDITKYETAKTTQIE